MIWKEDDDYDYIDNLSFHGIAFEFVRRNPQYLTDYQDYAHRTDALTASYGQRSIENESKWRTDDLFWIFIPEKAPGQSTATWFRHTAIKSQVPPYRAPYDQHYRVKWGLITLPPSPHEPAYTHTLFISKPEYPKIPYSIEAVSNYFVNPDDCDSPGIEGSASTQDPHFLVAVFSLDLPLKAQVEKLNRLLRTAHADRKETFALRPSKVKKPSGGKKKLKKYIRILDAKNAGASNADMSSVFHPHKHTGIANNSLGEKSISDDYASAKQYRDVNYLLIAWMRDSEETHHQ